MKNLERYCVICRKSVDKWISVEDQYPTSEFIRRTGVIGGDLKNCVCPRCHSVDRVRHLYLYLLELKLIPLFRSAKILHLAPEPIIELIINSQKPSKYILADLQPRRKNIVPMDMQSTHLPSDEFDWVISNHVLEHVDEPLIAIREARRILKVGGLFLCQTPFALKLDKTFHSPYIHTVEDKIFFYGQANHQRVFGRDITVLIENEGFSTRCSSHPEVLRRFAGERFGVNEDEPFFLFEKISG